jgi:hypothetical protein
MQARRWDIYRGMQERRMADVARDIQAIDAVITWVDGTAPEHLARRLSYMGAAGGDLHENAVNPHRWASADEIYYCLQSIGRFAPWVRRIWIVVEQEGPDLSQLADVIGDKISIVRHAEIFAGFEAALPTFNSLAIETLLWRIDGLAERFLYFNDDVFLTAPLEPQDVFAAEGPVLRGAWSDDRALMSWAGARSDPALFNYFMQVNAAELAGFGAGHYFRAAHVVHPMQRSVMARLFAQHGAAFARNVGPRFRDLDQFLPQGLHNHACLAAQAAVISGAPDHVHIHSGQGVDAARVQMARIAGAEVGAEEAEVEVKMLCINDLPQLEQSLPDIRDWLDRVIVSPAGHSVSGRV